MWWQKKVQVTCIGSTSLDIFFPTEEAVIIDTPDDLLSQKKLALELGGKALAPDIYFNVGGVAANVSQGLSLSGITASCYSMLGDDENGRFCLEALKKNKVLTENIALLHKTHTDTSAIIVLLPSGERTIVHNRNSNKRLVVKKERLNTPWIFVSALNGQWQQNMETILEAKKERGFSLALNPGQHNIKEDPFLIERIMSQVDVLVLNKDEALEIVLHKDDYLSTEKLENESFLLTTLLSFGPKVVALTDGSRGAWVANKKEQWFLPVPPNPKVVDSTGAGDAFTSGFLGAVLAGKSLDEGLRCGMANSQSVIQYYGCSKGLLTAASFTKAIAHLVPKKLV